MRIGIAHEDARHGGVVTTYNDLLRSNGLPTSALWGTRYDVAPLGAFDGLLGVTNDAAAGVGRAMAPYFRALAAQAGQREPEIGDDDRCPTCKQHYADPHDPDCPNHEDNAVHPKLRTETAAHMREQFAGRLLRPAAAGKTVSFIHITTR